MPVKKYSDFLQVSPSFESVVDIAADERNHNLWREYIVGDDMEKLVEFLCQTLGYESPDSRRSLWIHGTYGTGKSYAAILVKHLLEEKPEVVDAFLQGSIRLSKFRNRMMNCRKNGDYLVIWKTGCTGIRTGDQLLMEAEFAIRDALTAKFGDKADFGSASLQDAVKEQLASRSINWDNVLEDTTLGEDYGTLEELVEAVEDGDLKATKEVAEVIRQNHWGLINNVETFKKWVEEIIGANGLAKSGIFFIWDEFTDYLRYGDDQVIMQQISEFCKQQPLFMCFIVHKDSSWVDSMGNATYQQITHRFHEVEFHVSADAAYDLIAGSIAVRNGMEQNWKEAKQDPVRVIKPFLPDIVGLDDKISEKIGDLCPIHPMTIKLLSRVSESFAASQRTMFKFMKDSSDETLGFPGYIQQSGPQDETCWLTPEWLWDYFFTRESDFRDKDTKAAEYIQHYEQSREMVENDKNALRVFKAAMLLMAVMSTTGSIYTGARANNGIAATAECLKTCFSGVLSAKKVDDYLATFSESRILLTEETRTGVRLQLPYTGNGGELQPIIDRLGKDQTRYLMFAKDGKLSSAFEDMAVDKNDAVYNRMKTVICCAEKMSLDKRIQEVTDDLKKYPHKIGLVYVAAKDDTQASAIQSELEQRARDSGEDRLVIALLRTPFTDDDRSKWIRFLAQAELARNNGKTADANHHDMEAATIVSRWVSTATAGKMTAWCGEKKFANQFGTAQLRKTIRTGVLDELFPFSPESVVITNTAFKSCSDPAVLSGIQRKATTSQWQSVLLPLKQLGVLDETEIKNVEKLEGNKSAATVAALAKFVRERMESGSKVVLSEMWDELQKPPFGFYNCIACGVLMGYVFSFYKDSSFSWVDSATGTFTLNEANLKTLVVKLCRNQMSTDYLSAGSITWQKFREYLKKIFKLDDGQTANETEGMRSVREAVTAAGAPFWSLKYLTEEDYGSEDFRDAAVKIVDNIQVFISQDGDTDEAMSTVLQLFNGRGKLRERITKAFQDKAVLAKAFSVFLFESSPTLKEITEKLNVHSESLRDKVFGVMQNAIYTWTEDQVCEKLAGVVSEYSYLDALNKSMRKEYHSPEEALKDLKNAFGYLRISILALESLNLPWYEAVTIMHRVSKSGITHMTVEEREADTAVLNEYGTAAWEFILDAKPALVQMLEHKENECTREEIDAIYEGLREVSCEANAAQFDRELNAQLSKITQTRNRTLLKEKWINISSTESVMKWCNDHGYPLLWLVPEDMAEAIRTLIAVQNNKRPIDQDVQSAIAMLDKLDTTILTDNDKAGKLFMEAIDGDYRDIFEEKRDVVIAELKQKLGNDVSKWDVKGLTTVQKTLKRYKSEKAKKEKLQKTKDNVQTMKDTDLRSKVAAFLDAHPEFCDEFK